MSASPPAYLPPDMARARVREELDTIDAALARLRQCCTDEVGTAFRIELAERLEHQERLQRRLDLLESRLDALSRPLPRPQASRPAASIAVCGFEHGVRQLSALAQTGHPNPAVST